MTRLHHLWDGPADAPVLLLLHPIATHSGIWGAQLGPWSQRFRVLRVDLPGHGQSPPEPGVRCVADHARRVVELLDALQVARVAVVGLSFGGMVAQALTLGWPERVQALVLAHTTARTEPAVQALWRLRAEAAQRDGMPSQAAATLARWFTPGFAAASPLTLRWVGDMIGRTPLAGYLAAVHAIQHLDHLAALGGVQVPTLVVTGAEDQAMAPATAAALAAAIPGAHCHVVPGASHLGCVEQAVAFTECVGGFLSEACVAQPLHRL